MPPKTDVRAMIEALTEALDFSEAFEWIQCAKCDDKFLGEKRRFGSAPGPIPERYMRYCPFCGADSYYRYLSEEQEPPSEGAGVDE